MIVHHHVQYTDVVIPHSNIAVIYENWMMKWNREHYDTLSESQKIEYRRSLTYENMRFDRIKAEYEKGKTRQVLDHEAWPIASTEPDVARDTVKKLITLLKRAKAECPHIQFGIFGYFPNVFPALIDLNQSRIEYAQYEKINEIYSELIDYVDFVCPVFYTENILSGLYRQRTARAVEQVRKYTNKPIIPFISSTQWGAGADAKVGTHSDWWILNCNVDYLPTEIKEVICWDYGSHKAAPPGYKQFIDKFEAR